MFSDSTEIIEAGICGVKCRPPALTSAPVVTYRVRFSLPLLSKRIKTLTRNCDLLWSSMKKKGRKREGEKTTTRLGHVQEAERVCSPCVCASGRDRNSLKMVEIKADRHWDFHRYLHRGEKNLLLSRYVVAFSLALLAWYRYAYYTATCTCDSYYRYLHVKRTLNTRVGRLEAGEDERER